MENHEQNIYYGHLSRKAYHNSISKTFNITVKDKKTKKTIKNLRLKIKVNNITYAVKTNSIGIAIFNPKSLVVGSYKVVIYTDNIKYKVSATSKIKIT